MSRVDSRWLTLLSSFKHNVCNARYLLDFNTEVYYPLISENCQIKAVLRIFFIKLIQNRTACSPITYTNCYLFNRLKSRIHLVVSSQIEV